MNIKDQVLSIEQIKELQELGFDVNKYSSVCVTEAKDRNKYIVDRRLVETEIIEYHETLTIGDIMECLPEKIKTYSAIADKELYFYLRVTKAEVIYAPLIIDDSLSCSNEDKFINNLFKTLVWCIKQKHIAL